MSAKSKRAKSRIYWREQGGERRYYADFRDVGGTREALKVPGSTRATTDIVVAEAIVARRLDELHEAKRTADTRKVKGEKEARTATLAAFASEYLVRRAKSGKYADSWLENLERMLRIAAEHFGADRDLRTIDVDDVRAWMEVVAARPNGRGMTPCVPCEGAGKRDGVTCSACNGRGKVGGGVLGKGAVRHYLNALSGLYASAQSGGYVDVGYNPVAVLEDKPVGDEPEAEYFEVHEAARYLEAARTYTPARADRALPFLYPLIATYLLTGGRETEVLGLEVSDISFERKTVTIRPNQWRRLKTKRSARVVPLWPQLEAILRDYLRTTRRVAGLLFPSPYHETDAMVTDFRKGLDAIAERAGWKAGEIRSKRFRHTYCTARVQTLDRGAPVALYTVSREMGHSSTDLVEQVYAHVGQINQRSEVVEYRVKENEQAPSAPRLTLSA